MAHSTPHLEDGYLKIAHGIHQVLAQGILSYREMRVVLFLLGKTYAWGKKEDWVSVSQFVDGTGIERRNMQHLLKKMVAKNILKKDGDVLHPTYGFNKYHETWKVGVVDLTTGQFNHGGVVVLTTTASGQKDHPQKKYKKINTPLTSFAGAEARNQTRGGSSLSPPSEVSGGSGGVLPADLQTNETNVRKNTLGTHFADGSDGEDVIDADTGEVAAPPVKKGVLPMYRALLKWAEEKRGFGFPNATKQYAAFKAAKLAGITPDQLKARWCELARDDFFKTKGFDWTSVVSSFNRKQ